MYYRILSVLFLEVIFSFKIKFIYWLFEINFSLIIAFIHLVVVSRSEWEYQNCTITSGTKIVWNYYKPICFSIIWVLIIHKTNILYIHIHTTNLTYKSLLDAPIILSHISNVTYNIIIFLLVSCMHLLVLVSVT